MVIGMLQLPAIYAYCVFPFFLSDNMAITTEVRDAISILELDGKILEKFLLTFGRFIDGWEPRLV